MGHIALSPKIQTELAALADKLKSEDKLLSDRQLTGMLGSQTLRDELKHALAKQLPEHTASYRKERV